MPLTRINNQALPTLDHSKMPSGSVLQHVEKLVTTSHTFTGNNSVTPTAMTAFDTSITPKIAGSKIKITLNANFAGTSSTPMLHVFFKKNSGTYAEIDVNTDTSIGNRRRGFTSTGYNFADGNQQRNHTAIYYHSPSYSVGDVIHYKVYFTSDNTNTFMLNKSNSDSNNDTGTRSFSTLILEEIAD